MTVTLTISDPSVARLVTSQATGDTVTVEIPVGSDRSPTSVASGGAPSIR